jgi:EAL domain-containing protein (putative c-di-GMP-specific phosphodiesterase class I)
LACWRHQGFTSLQLAINLSPKEFEREDLPERLLQRSGRLRHPGSAVDIEITENLLMKDAEKNISMVKQLRNGGLRVSIDDFGTRYSSLNYLRRFPINSIKIDQSFVRDLNPTTTARPRSFTPFPASPTASVCASWPRASKPKPRGSC